MGVDDRAVWREGCHGLLGVSVKYARLDLPGAELFPMLLAEWES